MHQHPGQRTARPPPAMYPAPALLAHQTGTLQCPLHPGVAEPDVLLLPQLLVKMAHVEIEILLSIQNQHPFGQLQRYTPQAGTTPAPVQQSVVTELLPASPPAPHLPVANADHLCGLPPSDALGHSS